MTHETLEKTQDRNELEQLVSDNLGLVHSCAKRFSGKGIEYEDLFQAGCMGLVKACKRFDASLGNRLSTYAVPVILGEIKRLFRDGGSVKVSRKLKELSVRVSRAASDIFMETGEEATSSQIAERLECGEQEVVEAVCAARPSVSLTVDDEDEWRVLDIPVVDDSGSCSDRLTLISAVERLERDERELVRLRFFVNKTQSQTAKIFNTTQVQISRRERRIIIKLRELMAE